MNWLDRRRARNENRASRPTPHGRDRTRRAGQVVALIGVFVALGVAVNVAVAEGRGEAPANAALDYVAATTTTLAPTTVPPSTSPPTTLHPTAPTTTAPPTTAPPATTEPSQPGPTTPAGSSRSFAFTFTNPDGSPVRWDPCKPIPYVLNLDGAPPGAQADIEEALRRVTTQTRLPFVYLGETSERPSIDRPISVPERYGSGPAPVLFAWQRPGGDSPLENGNEVGVTVNMAASIGITSFRYMTAQVVLNAGRDLQSGFGRPGKNWGSTIQHEVGHLAGLSHVGDRDQLMFPRAGEAGDWGAGDLAGLARLGADAGCLGE